MPGPGVTTESQKYGSRAGHVLVVESPSPRRTTGGFHSGPTPTVASIRFSHSSVQALLSGAGSVRHATDGRATVPHFASSRSASPRHAQSRPIPAGSGAGATAGAVPSPCSDGSASRSQVQQDA